jgi:lysophospholipase L1-like esterase
MGTPFWQGNVIYNESVMLLQGAGGTDFVGNLQFTPKKILSVRSFDYTVEYLPGVDYTVSGKTLKKVVGSDIPSWTHANVTGAEIPPPYRSVELISVVETDCQPWGGVSVYSESSFWYGHQVYVSYVYDTKDVNLPAYPVYGERVPRFLEKLKNGDPVNLLAIGDSVMAGASASLELKREPMMPRFIELFTQSLQENYASDVTLFNKAVGGETSAWAPKNTLKAVADTHADIVFVHFGINDNGSSTSTGMYFQNLQETVLNTRAVYPDVEFVFVHCFVPHPQIYSYDKLQEYFSRVNDFAAATPGVDIVDLFTLSRDLLAGKKYQDVTGNGINHANDYLARIYHQALSARYIPMPTV